MMRTLCNRLTCSFGTFELEGMCTVSLACADCHQNSALGRPKIRAWLRQLFRSSSLPVRNYSNGFDFELNSFRNSKGLNLWRRNCAKTGHHEALVPLPFGLEKSKPEKVVVLEMCLACRRERRCVFSWFAKLGTSKLIWIFSILESGQVATVFEPFGLLNGKVNGKVIERLWKKENLFKTSASCSNKRETLISFAHTAIGYRKGPMVSHLIIECCAHHRKSASSLRPVSSGELLVETLHWRISLQNQSPLSIRGLEEHLSENERASINWHSTFPSNLHTDYLFI